MCLTIICNWMADVDANVPGYDGEWRRGERAADRKEAIEQGWGEDGEEGQEGLAGSCWEGIKNGGTL